MATFNKTNQFTEDLGKGRLSRDTKRFVLDVSNGNFYNVNRHTQRSR